MATTPATSLSSGIIDADHTDLFLPVFSSFSWGDKARDFCSKWGLFSGPSKPCPPLCTGSVLVSHIWMPRSGSPQGGRLVLRLAIACALQDAWVVLVRCLWWPIGPALIRRLSWWLVRPALVLGCQSSQGPPGLVPGFYHAHVWCLDVAHLNCEG
jgi:hypothetical protein